MGKPEYSVFYPTVIILAVILPGIPVKANRTRIAHASLVVEHASRVHNFTCDEPQRRLVQLTDLDILLDPLTMYTPRATVLRRCDIKAGYCSSPDYGCGPSEVKNEELIFRSYNVASRTSAYVTVNAEDHIRCACQPFGDQI